MKLSDKQKIEATKKLSDFLEKNKPSCSLCKSKQWVLIERVFELREFQESGPPGADNSILPVVPLVCSKCGNILFFNAIQLGFLKKHRRGKKKG